VSGPLRQYRGADTQATNAFFFPGINSRAQLVPSPRVYAEDYRSLFFSFLPIFRNG
jgi:hypothetical protein